MDVAVDGFCVSLSGTAKFVWAVWSTFSGLVGASTGEAPIDFSSDMIEKRGTFGGVLAWNGCKSCRQNEVILDEINLF